MDDKVDIDTFTLSDIKLGYKKCTEKQEEVVIQMILLKMQRDLLAISSTIVSDQNLKNNQNHKVIKEQIQTLSKYMYKEIEYIKLACEYENTLQAQKVREKLLSCEYALTKYNQTLDYAFWEDKEVYIKEGALEQLRKLKEIHNSELSIKTVKLFTDSLDYQIIRDNNWGRGYLHIHHENLTRKRSNQDLGYAREQFRKDRNDSIRKLFKLFDFINSINDILLSNYFSITFNPQYSVSYRLEKYSQKEIYKEAREFQKSLKTGQNASCWN